MINPPGQPQSKSPIHPWRQSVDFVEGRDRPTGPHPAAIFGLPSTTVRPAVVRWRPTTNSPRSRSTAAHGRLQHSPRRRPRSGRIQVREAGGEPATRLDQRRPAPGVQRRFRLPVSSETSDLDGTGAPGCLPSAGGHADPSDGLGGKHREQVERYTEDRGGPEAGMTRQQPAHPPTHPDPNPPQLGGEHAGIGSMTSGAVERRGCRPKADRSYRHRMIVRPSLAEATCAA
jgi:hypothetical protein